MDDKAAARVLVVDDEPAVRESLTNSLVFEHRPLSGGMMRRGGDGYAQQISAWVQANFTAQTIGGVTVYELS
jgi:hypothetical protein